MENRGSTWHKWDLHVHTPASFHWGSTGDSKNFRNMSDAEKQKALQDFAKTINDSEVDVFAVQDYWTFDWILALREYQKTNKTLNKLVLPGMELRIECPVNFRLNIHVILNDNLTDQQLRDFRSELKVRYSGGQHNLSDDAIINFAKTLDVSKAKQCGFGDPSGLSDDELWKLGSMTVEVTRDSLEKAMDKLPPKSGFILLPYNTSDGIVGLDWKTQPQADNYFMQVAHIFETRQQENVDLFNGRKTNKNKDIIDNFMKTLGGKSKPCVAGSDAHTFTDYGKYPSNKTTWIKGSLSFSGLEQIIYEPSDRVKIQELKPEEKSPQDLIDKVEFIGKAGKTEVVYLNQNLNSLIGSRAQGKSNLLKNIAYAVEPSQTNSRGVDTDDFLELNTFKVYWADGTMQTLDINEDKDKGILFIPQRYLGELVYDKNPKFDEFLTSLFENKGAFQEDLATCRKAEDQNTLAISTILKEMFEALRLGIEKRDRIRKLGSKDSFDKEIKDLEDRIKTAGASGLVITVVELKEYDQYKSDEKAKKSLLDITKGDIESLKTLKADGVIGTDRLDYYTFSVATYAKIEKELTATDKQFKIDVIDKEIEILTAQRDSIQKDITTLVTKITPFADKIKKNEVLASLTKALDLKKTTRQEIGTLSKEMDDQKVIYVQKKKDLINQYAVFGKEYNKLSIDLGDLKFSNVELVITFDESSFKQAVDEIINYHNSIEFKKDDNKERVEVNKLLNDPSSWHYEAIDNLKNILIQLIDGVISGNLKLKAGHDRESAIDSLLKSRYKIDFPRSVTSKAGVSFRNMSDGEQMLALLEFIFKFDDYNYPVLLDQPEDDLDSKAISSTVVEFLKLEKSTRQIIIASHNANLVVCGDSENVIVSHKDSGKTPTFSYTTGAIEDGNTNKEIVEILEGGAEAFEMRRNKLDI